MADEINGSIYFPLACQAFRLAGQTDLAVPPKNLSEFRSNYALVAGEGPLGRYSENHHAYPGDRSQGDFCVQWPGKPNDKTVYPISFTSVNGKSCIVISDGKTVYDYNELRLAAGLEPIVACLMAYGANISPVKQALVDDSHWVTIYGWLDGYDVVWSQFPAAGNAISVLHQSPGCKARVAINLVTAEQKEKMDASEGDTYVPLVADLEIPGGSVKCQVYAGQGNTFAPDGVAIPVAGIERRIADGYDFPEPMTSEHVVNYMLEADGVQGCLTASTEFRAAFSVINGYELDGSVDAVEFAKTIRHLRFANNDDQQAFKDLRVSLNELIPGIPIEIAFEQGSPEGLGVGSMAERANLLLDPGQDTFEIPQSIAHGLGANNQASAPAHSR